MPAYDFQPCAPSAAEKHARLALRGDGSLRLAVVSDTHAGPHPDALRLVAETKPDAILHGGDIGALGVLAKLAAIAPLFAVRGKIDLEADAIPDRLVLDLVLPDAPLDSEAALRILLIHIAVAGPKLRADAARVAKERAADLVVCGHSHVPLVARDARPGGPAIFNPGSIGPRRFQLPIVFGTIDIAMTGVTFTHVDCETGEPWRPYR